MILFSSIVHSLLRRCDGEALVCPRDCEALVQGWVAATKLFAGCLGATVFVAEVAHDLEGNVSFSV